MKLRIFCLLLMVFLALPVYSTQEAPVNDSSIVNVNWDDYVTELENKIKDSWNLIPHKGSTEIVVAFEIKKDGQVDNVAIKKSSGNKDEDDKAIKAINNISPLNPLPDGYLGSSLSLSYTFNKKLPQNQTPQAPAKSGLIDNFRKLNSDYYLRYQSKNPWL